MAGGAGPARVEYFYSAHSAYAYIGAGRLAEICAAHGCVIEHRPIRLSPVVEAVSGLPFAGRSKHHVDYYFGREIERWADFRGVPVIGHRPTHHDNPLDLPNGLIIAAVAAGADADRLSQAILTAHWRDDADIADAATLAAVAEAAGIDPGPLLSRALGPEVQAVHDANTAEAIERGVFGSPTYFLDGDMFYGQDHLELMERALVAPYPPPRFRNP